MGEKVTSRYLGILIALGVFILQALSLPHVGMTWDEPASFFIGRANLRFWMTGDRGYLTDFSNSTRFQNDPFQYIYGEELYPPFSFVISSATSYILAERLHLVTPITAHHLGLVMVGALGVLGMFGICMTVGFSPFISSVVTLLYATYPTIVGQMRNDAKDIPLLSMIVIFVYFVLRWIGALKEKNVKRQVLFGFLAAVSLGLAEGTKVSAAIIVFILLFWVGASSLLFPSFRHHIAPLWKRGIEGGMLGIIALGVFFLSWPWLWDAPIEKLQEVWSFFKTVGYNMPTLYIGTLYRAGITLPKMYPWGILSFQTPPTLLFLGGIGVIGVIGAVLKKRNPFALLVIIWIGIGMGRFLLPGVLIYAKVRHFIDVMPAFFLLIGFGLEYLGELGRSPLRPDLVGTTRGAVGGLGKLEKKRIIGVIGGLLLAHQLIIIFQFFPYEPSYFNVFIGGTKAVAEKRLFDSEYWASSVKESMDYLNTNGEKPVTVYACMMGHLARFYENNGSKVMRTAGGATYVLVPNSPSWFDGAIDFMEMTHKRIYTIRRGGADLFFVYKQVSPRGWRCGNETKMMYTLE